MKKVKQDFKVLSNVVCVCCGKPLKQNLIDKNPNANTCYVCFMIDKKVGREWRRFNEFIEKRAKAMQTYLGYVKANWTIEF